MQKQHGLTLIELMVVLAIAAVLAVMAAPSFTGMIRSSTVSSSVNTFMSDMRFARSEAIRRGGGVVMCRSDDPEAAPPVCGTGHGPGNNGWVSGWIIFHDLNNDGVADAGELDPPLRIQAPDAAVGKILETGGSSSTSFRFTATGRMLSTASATTLRFGGDFPTGVQRTVCVNVGGRARIAGDGTATC